MERLRHLSGEIQPELGARVYSNVAHRFACKFVERLTQGVTNKTNPTPKAGQHGVIT